MKKSISLLIAIVLVLVIGATFALSACDNKTTDPGKTDDTTTQVTWSDWQVKTDASCTRSGLKTRQSSDGKVESEAIPALGHNFVDDVCTRCGAVSSEKVLAYSQLTYGEDADYITMYEKYGEKVSIADVEEAADGKAYIYVKGDDIVTKTTEGAVKTELGMDFLSMAMVYNVAVPASWTGKTENDVYAQWWKLYIQRWNMLLPEIPLYSNEYYDMYNTKLGGVVEYPTNPYWNPANAMIEWTSTDGKIILGNSTDLSGKFRYPSFGATSPGGADNDVYSLCVGLGTVTTNKLGDYIVDTTVVKSLDSTVNANGTLTYTVEIKDDLKFSDGSAITAKNYLATLLVFSTPVAAEAAGKDHKAGLSYVGYNAFAKYDGTNAAEEGVSKEFAGVRLLGDYKFSVTVTADYANYFYKLAYAGFNPNYLPMWLGDADIADDGNGAYLTDSFYAKADDKYAKAAIIKATAFNADTTYPYSGAYVVSSYDKDSKTANLTKNTYYKGNYDGKVPSITNVSYVGVKTDTQLATFKSGGVDVIAGITGGKETNEAIAYAKGADGELGTADDAATMTHYSRAGYGKLGFRGDFGPVQFSAVREAIALCLDRSDFASQFTGGYGGVVDGPYYTGAWMYQAVKKDIIINKYSKSVDAAKDVLTADGWIYDATGAAYTSGVRYKKISANLISDADKNYSSLDGSIKTIKLDDNTYLMPLLLNWFGTTENDFTDLLKTEFMGADSFAQAGFAIKGTFGEFAPMLNELYQLNVYGETYSGTPRYTCFNFASSFSSAVYDYSWNWSVEPNMFAENSVCYIKDYADYYLIPKAE